MVSGGGFGGDESADFLGELACACGGGVLVADGGFGVAVAYGGHEFLDGGAFLGEECEGGVAEVVESEVGSACGFAGFDVHAAEGVGVDWFVGVADGGEYPGVGVVGDVFEEFGEGGGELGGDVLVADAVDGFGFAGFLGAHGLAADADVEGEGFEVDVPAAQGADLADARALQNTAM